MVVQVEILRVVVRNCLECDENFIRGVNDIRKRMGVCMLFLL